MFFRTSNRIGTRRAHLGLPSSPDPGFDNIKTWFSVPFLFRSGVHFIKTPNYLLNDYLFEIRPFLDKNGSFWYNIFCLMKYFEKPGTYPLHRKLPIEVNKLLGFRMRGACLIALAISRVLSELLATLATCTWPLDLVFGFQKVSTIASRGSTAHLGLTVTPLSLTFVVLDSRITAHCACKFLTSHISPHTQMGDSRRKLI